MKYLDILTGALQKIQCYSPSEALTAADMQYSLRELNMMWDFWSARRIMAYNVNFAVFNIQANHQPHTIGPGGDFDVTQRPVRIESCNWILNNSGSVVDVPMNIRDDAWWAGEQVKEIKTNIPTDLYYSPDFPLGNCYFWPISNVAGQVRLEQWVLLPSATKQTDIVVLPPGYWNAVEWNLAIRIAPAFGAAANVNQLVIQMAKDALEAIEGNNAASPRVASKDAGMEVNRRNGKGGGGFNWLSGQPS
jgi:hypothetical protein